MSLLRRHFRLLYQLPKRFHQTRPKLCVSRDVVPIFGNANLFPDNIALKDNIGKYTYSNIFLSAKELSSDITRQLDGKTNQRVLFLCSNDADYVITLWAIWMSGQIAVPLSPLHPKNILLYYANDTKAGLLITTTTFSDLMQRVATSTNTNLYILDEKQRLNSTTQTLEADCDLEAPLPATFYSKTNALILYTSGTTGNPKGVVLSHKNVNFQVNTLVDAWKWTEKDAILHTLPLHHVHGIVNALLCPLFVGAQATLLPKFSANSVWSNLLGMEDKAGKKTNVFMAVPTIYAKLIDEYGRLFKNDPKMVDYIRNTLKTRVRLMVSGSAPLPVPVFEKWECISGHKLLERYGMTEIGMCLSNSYGSVVSREPKFVGLPLPGVKVRLVSEDGNTMMECDNSNGEMVTVVHYEAGEDGSVTGELHVKSDGVFSEYFNRPETTQKEFGADKWFKTGDLVAFHPDKKKFRILGRKSTDIIKTGGYKVSALQIETVLLENERVKDCAVVAVADEKWGEKVAAILVVVDDDSDVDVNEVRSWCANKLPKYMMPSVVKVVQKIPKNAMGKVNKKELVRQFFDHKHGV